MLENPCSLTWVLTWKSLSNLSVWLYIALACLPGWPHDGMPICCVCLYRTDKNIWSLCCKYLCEFAHYHPYDVVREKD